MTARRRSVSRRWKSRRFIRGDAALDLDEFALGLSELDETLLGASVLDDKDAAGRPLGADGAHRARGSPGRKSVAGCERWRTVRASADSPLPFSTSASTVSVRDAAERLGEMRVTRPPKERSGYALTVSDTLCPGRTDWRSTVRGCRCARAEDSCGRWSPLSTRSKRTRPGPPDAQPRSR